MVKTEEEVVRNEIRMRTENGNIPFFPILEYVNKLSYPEDHPYHRPMAGDHTTIRNISLADIQDWTASRYQPASTTIMVVGDLQADSPQDLITALLRNLDPSLFHPDLTEDHLVRFPKEGIADPNPDDASHGTLRPEPENEDEPISAAIELEARAAAFSGYEPPAEPLNPELQVYEATVADPKVIVTWTLPPAYQGNDTLLSMAGIVLSNVVDGHPVLGQLDDPNIAEFEGCGAIQDKRASTMVCTATVKDPDKRPGEVAEAMIDQLYLMKNPDYQRLWKSQFSYVRNQQLADTLRSLDLFAAVGEGRATDIAQFAHFTGRPDYHSSQMRETMTLEIEAVASIFDTYITRERASMALIKPVDRDDLLEVSGDGSAHYNVSNQGSGDAFLLDSETLSADAVREAFQGPAFDTMKEVTLSNGMKVVLAPHGEAPVVRAVLVVGGGSAHDPDSTDAIRYRYTDHEWPEDPLRIAGTYGFSRNQGHEALLMEASAGNLDGMLWMMREGVDSLRINLLGDYSNPSITEFVKNGKSRVVKNFGDIDWHISDLVDRHVNPGHPAATATTLADYDRFKALSRAELQALLEQKWQPSNATLILVGNLDMDKALDLAANAFGGWQPSADTPAYVLPEVAPPNPAEGSKVLVFDEPGKTQTEVVLTCPVEHVGNAPAPAHRVLGTALGNELSTILRETAGVVYSPYAYASSSLAGDARAVFGARVQNSAAAFTVQTYRTLVERMEKGEFSDDQILQETYAAAQKYVLNQQSVAQLASRLQGAVGNQRDWSYFGAYGETLAGLGIEDLQAVLGECGAQSIVTLKGPEEEITPLLDEAGIEHEVVDWKQRGYDLHKAQDPKGYAKAEKKRLKAEAKAEKKKAEGGDESDTTEDAG